jgi:hypothetical protein
MKNIIERHTLSIESLTGAIAGRCRPVRLGFAGARIGIPWVRPFVTAGKVAEIGKSHKSHNLPTAATPPQAAEALQTLSIRALQKARTNLH